MRAALTVLAVIGAVHLSAQLIGCAVVADITQVLLMPLLASALWAGTGPPRGRLVRLTFLGLGCSWLGDTIPRFLDGDPGFLGMLGSFWGAQLFYSIAFWPRRHRSLLVRPLAALPYLLVAVTVVALSAPGARVLLPAVMVYAAVLCVMALLATGMGTLGGIGGAVFVVSDSLIALDAFGALSLPAHSVWVMATYLAAQVMLVLAVREQDRVEDGESQ
ncbi:MAG: lysoplasmalogenase [Brachybacterium sp.]|nr:lysoplasmalogenase [Brachybacterium sp.]MDN5900091.1 lysoplasmalogenase [Brachybacterium sp.]